jgi:hypothetical protein
MYFIRHCFIYRPSDSTMSEYAGIDAGLWRLWHWQSDASFTSRLILIHNAAITHPQRGYNSSTTRLNLIHNLHKLFNVHVSWSALSRRSFCNCFSSVSRSFLNFSSTAVHIKLKIFLNFWTESLYRRIKWEIFGTSIWCQSLNEELLYFSKFPFLPVASRYFQCSKKCRKLPLGPKEAHCVLCTVQPLKQRWRNKELSWGCLFSRVGEGYFMLVYTHRLTCILTSWFHMHAKA